MPPERLGNHLQGITVEVSKKRDIIARHHTNTKKQACYTACAGSETQMASAKIPTDERFVFCALAHGHTRKSLSLVVRAASRRQGQPEASGHAARAPPWGAAGAISVGQDG